MKIKWMQVTIGGEGFSGWWIVDNSGHLRNYKPFQSKAEAKAALRGCPTCGLKFGQHLMGKGCSLSNSRD